MYNIHAQCRRAGIEVKSAHGIRRTVASEMRRKKAIEDIKTDHKYTFGDE